MAHLKLNIAYCPNCGAGKEYDLVAGRCPNCGAELDGIGGGENLTVKTISELIQDSGDLELLDLDGEGLYD